MTVVLRSLGLLIALLIATVPCALARGERAVDIETRPGVTLRFLLAEPPTPKGSVILLAGGHGRLELSNSGVIGWGALNQLVRTRQDYAAAGYVTAVPDVPSDMKGARSPEDVARGYRWSDDHARDMGALVAYLAKIRKPVWIIGTSRGSLAAANAVARLTENRADGLVLTAGMLMARPALPEPPSIQKVVDLDRLDVPVLIVHNRLDDCWLTPAADVEPFRKLLTRAPSVEVAMLRGGRTLGDPCDAMAYHGFNGIDHEVVRTVVKWLDRQPR